MVNGDMPPSLFFAVKIMARRRGVVSAWAARGERENVEAAVIAKMKHYRRWRTYAASERNYR